MLQRYPNVNFPTIVPKIDTLEFVFLCLGRFSSYLVPIDLQPPKIWPRNLYRKKWKIAALKPATEPKIDQKHPKTAQYMHKVILFDHVMSRNRPLSRFQQVSGSYLFYFRKWPSNIWLEHFLSPEKQFFTIFPALAVYVSKTSFWRRITLTGRTYRQNSSICCSSKNTFFGQSGLYSQDSAGHGFLSDQADFWIFCWQFYSLPKTQISYP